MFQINSLVTVVSSCDVAKITSVSNLIIRSTMILASWIEMRPYTLKTTNMNIKVPILHGWNNHITLVGKQNFAHSLVSNKKQKNTRKITSRHATIGRVTKGVYVKAMEPRLKAGDISSYVRGACSTKETTAKVPIRNFISNYLHMIIWM